MQNLTILNEEDFKEVNSEIVSGYGNNIRIVSGTIIHQEDGDIYNISTESYQINASYLKKIGKLVKEKFGAKEVRYFGVKIA